ncbi:MAG: alkaline phosphatase family protein [Rubrobacteraceae bacterium]
MNPKLKAPSKPVLLLVLDGIRPDVMRSAIRDGDAPALGTLAERGEARWDAVSVFPSITPAATAAIATGEPPAGSGIPGHAWYDADEDEVVVYGAKTETVISSGPIRVFHNNVWRMNRDDLLATTLFEELHEIGFDGACVHFPIRRGPHEHPVRMKTVEGYLKGGRYLSPSVSGPKEYFLGDLFYSSETGFSGRKGNGGLHRSIGINDEYAAEVGAKLVAEKTAPFTLVYFFHGDKVAHREGIAAQRRHVVLLDEYVSRIFDAAGGMDEFLEENAVIAVSDHGHAPLLPKRRFINLARMEGQRVSLGANASFASGADVVAVPNGRAALLYLRDVTRSPRVAEVLSGRRGVDLAAWRDENGWISVRRVGRELRFKPGDGMSDRYGDSWELSGDPRALGLETSNGTLRYGDYPDALSRLWGCLRTGRAGDLALSASPGYTFGEVSGGYHEASDHGSLHREDSEVFSIACGVAAPEKITDVAPILLSHFEGTARKASRANITERNAS